MRTRLNPTDRKSAIMDAATMLSHEHGYNAITRQKVASAAGCSEALVSVYFKTMQALKRAVVRNAIEKCDLAIIAQAIALNDPQAKNLPVDLRELTLAVS